MVEAVEPAHQPSWEQTLVELSCLEDDAQGERLTVLWEREVDAQVLRQCPNDEAYQSTDMRGCGISRLRRSLGSSINPQLNWWYTPRMLGRKSHKAQRREENEEDVVKSAHA